MFFRREKPRIPSFDERLEGLKQAGVQSSRKGSDRAVLVRGRCAAVARQTGENSFTLEKTGIVVGKEIGELADGGNQKFWMTPSGAREPALAEQLRGLHALVEDIREGLGMTSLYNEGLGSTNSLHLYDRVKDRDQGQAKRAWEKAQA
jgi:hypothetical protein